ncbi:MAG: NHL repeat-containing protein, partial [Planctomycetota bacterium]
LAVDHVHDMVTTVVGEHGGGGGQLRGPAAVAFDPAGGLLYVSDAGNARLHLFRIERKTPGPVGIGFEPRVTLVRTVSGEALRREVGAGATAQGVSGPVVPGAVDVGPVGRVYVIDRAADLVLALDARLEHATLFCRLAEEHAPDPVDLAVAGEGERVLLLDRTADALLVYDRAGASAGRWDLPPSPDGRPTDARGIAVGPDDRVYVTDAGAHRIVVLDPDGRHERTLGGPGIVAGTFHAPRGIAIDDRQRIVVNDWGNHRVQVLSPRGQLEAIFGASLYTRPARP